MESITYHRGSSETALKNGTKCSIIYRNCTYQCGCRGNRAGMCSFFFKLAAAKCNQKMKSRFPIQHILNSKSNISNTTNSQFKFQVSTNTRILSNDKHYKHKVENCYNLLQLRQILLYIILESYYNILQLTPSLL